MSLSSEDWVGVWGEEGSPGSGSPWVTSRSLGELTDKSWGFAASPAPCELRTFLKWGFFLIIYQSSCSNYELCRFFEGKAMTALTNLDMDPLGTEELGEFG